MTAASARRVAITIAGFLAVCSCSSAGTSNSASGGGQQVTAKATGGRSGTAPIVVPDGQRQVVLGDRVLTINRVTQQLAANTSAIRVDVVVRNTGARAFPDQTARFQVMTPEGDVFQARAAGGSVRAGPIASGASRASTLVFDVPAAAVASLRLAYRAAADAPTVFVQLHVS